MKTLSRDRSEAIFDLFWTRFLKKKSEVDAVAEPQLPRKRRVPIRQEVGGTLFYIIFLQHQRNISAICIIQQLM